jgi:hypothetical protein
MTSIAATSLPCMLYRIVEYVDQAVLSRCHEQLGIRRQINVSYVSFVAIVR